MSLLITLGVVGGAAVLVGLYLLGIELSAQIVAHTEMFKERVSEIKTARNARRIAKQKEKAEKKAIQEETQQAEQTTELKVEVENVLNDTNL